ncbi:CotO family spore coat protein [Mesobacillus thioparans]|uniref:CotO family spore coat protein n=1 Tax=Mesobacillus thioparans TaxID=370439 RepID=UPI0039F06009
MGRKRNRKQSPLFYINQPVIDLPQPDMQKNYSIKSEPETSEVLLDQDNNPVNDEMNVEAMESSKEEVNHLAEEEENIKTDQSKVSGKRSFNDYTLEEKIKHLKLVPSSVAKVKYEFVTVERKYKGYFLELKGDILFIHSVTSRKKSVGIPKEDLIDIKRIGL